MLTSQLRRDIWGVSSNSAAFCRFTIGVPVSAMALGLPAVAPQTLGCFALHRFSFTRLATLLSLYCILVAPPLVWLCQSWLADLEVTYRNPREALFHATWYAVALYRLDSSLTAASWRHSLRVWFLFLATWLHRLWSRYCNPPRNGLLADLETTYLDPSEALCHAPWHIVALRRLDPPSYDAPWSSHSVPGISRLVPFTLASTFRFFLSSLLFPSSSSSTSSWHQLLNWFHTHRIDTEGVGALVKEARRVIIAARSALD